MAPAVSVARVWHTDLVLVSVRCELVTGKASLTWPGMMRAGDGNRTRMTSLEDRYGSARRDVLIRTCWSRASDDPLLTVGALRASWHLARAWPTDLPLR